VRAFSLAGGVVTAVASFYAYDPAFTGGVHVAAADLTGDGVAEIITGAGPSGGPHVRVIEFNGGALRELASFYAYDPAFRGGVYVAAADTTGDGVPEIITGAGPSGGPHVRVIEFNGGALRELASFYAYDPAFRGGVSVAGGDVTGDGIAEVITGAGAGGGPHVRVIDFSSGSPIDIASFYAYDPAFTGGVRVASAATPRGAVALAAASGSGGPGMTSTAWCWRGSMTPWDTASRARPQQKMLAAPTSSDRSATIAPSVFAPWARSTRASPLSTCGDSHVTSLRPSWLSR
jgi:hypothetical protein